MLKCEVESSDSTSFLNLISGQSSSNSDDTVSSSDSRGVVASVSGTVDSDVSRTDSTGNVNSKNSELSETRQNSVEQNNNSNSSDNSIKIKSAFLKENVGVKITGPCDEGFGLVMVPHIIINVDTRNTDIQLGKKSSEINYGIKLRKKGKDEYEEKVGIDLLKNVCETGKNFKFVAYIKGDELIIKWKVIEEGSNKIKKKLKHK